MLNGSLVMKERRGRKRRPPDMKDSCEYSEQTVTDNRQGVGAPGRKTIVYEMLDRASNLNGSFG
jgi:hypothetical protein